MIDSIVLDDLNIEASIQKYMDSNKSNQYSLSQEHGLKYIKILKNYSSNDEIIKEVLCFISKENGNILKAYGNKPSRIKIGNIFNY